MYGAIGLMFKQLRLDSNADEIFMRLKNGVMNFLGGRTLIAAVLVFLTAAVITTAISLGLIPDRNQLAVEERNSVCKTVSLNAALAVSRNSRESTLEVLQLFKASRNDVLSAAIRKKDGRLWAEIGNHSRRWDLNSTQDSTEDEIRTQFLGAAQSWGHMEVVFSPLRKPGVWGYMQSTTFRLVTFVCVSCFVLYTIFLRRILRGMDPSQAVPTRVRSALNILAEGLLVLDQNERIMLANHAFEDILGIPSDDLQGRQISTLPWEGHAGQTEYFPWSFALKEGNPQSGTMLRLQTCNQDYRTFIVNAAPVRNHTNAILGVVVCLEDVTPLEQERNELNKTLMQLEASRKEISRQNEHLRILATLDPLTECLNRRSFFEQFETQYMASQLNEFPLSCIMVDIDHFKLINDRRGHATGDAVLKSMSATLRRLAEQNDLVCRYGGEEFCILLPDADLERAYFVAERFRNAVSELEFNGFRVTSSFGISSSLLGATTPQELLQQADKALYLAKNNGRNQCVRWDHADRFPAIEEAPKLHTVTSETMTIPFHSVSALLSTLTYRDPCTAEHSVRVADLCVLTGTGLIPATDVYVLEIAALLHDIGKVGIPDSILMKPSSLTPEERNIIDAHVQIGVNIVRSTFAHPDLAEAIMHHHAWYDGNPLRPDLPKGRNCSTLARILAVADAYDAMISTRVYRKARTPEEAFSELRQGAGTQFDPAIVETFIKKLSERTAFHEDETKKISYETAMNIGQTIENLAYALDTRQKPCLAILAGKLKFAAQIRDLTNIGDVAGRLEDAIAHDADLEELAQITQQLLDLCRTVQRAYIQPVIETSKIDMCVVERESSQN